MSTENKPQSPSSEESKRFINHPYVAGIVVVIILAVLGAGYFYWYVPRINAEFAQARPAASTPPAQSEPPSLPIPPSAPAGQELLAQQLQKVKSTNIPLSENTSVLPSLNNQVAIIQLLLANQQFPAALNLLSSLENDAVLLPMQVQTVLQNAIEADRENIQKTQAVMGQLDGQLQQLEHYLNQQLLERLAQQNSPTPPTPNTETNVAAETTWNTKLWGKIKNLLGQGIKVQHKSAEISEPNFYTAIMLQMALQRAQFALEQGDWAEYQLTLSSLQTWVTTDLLTWVPDAPGMIKTIAELTEQPSPFANANVNHTQAAINSLMQELNP